MADELRLAFVFFPDGEVVPPDGAGERSIRLRAAYYPNGIAGKTGPAHGLDTSTSRFDGLRKGSEQDHGPERGEPSGWFRAFAPCSESLNLGGQSISPVGFANQAMTDSYSDTPQGAPGGATSYREAIDPVSAAMFADEIKSLHSRVVKVEESLRLGELAQYRIDGSIRTDVILHGPNEKRGAVSDFKNRQSDGDVD